MATGKTTPKHHAWKDRRTALSALWVFLVLNFMYADIFTLFFDKNAATQSTAVSGGSVFFFAVVMETAIAMVLLYRLLPRAWNRWTNIGVAVLHIGVLAYSLTGGTVTPFYAFFTAIEMVTLLFIVGYAWTWRGQLQPDPVALAAGA